ncbi:TPA: hypothetical protein QCI56_004527 [Enterobacter asburiae]|uniref:Uncharacterized protein n=1 Tax=Enterobacter asburiae TaxID=61645 RepID=A0A455VV06_ENTAS|nr:hypothetical protein MRY18106EAS_19020 [Enterobacter asburiae]HDR2659505.1 hypothetical protein [Enterobacter asburiae]HDR2663546.1 hypothetical protein [Enterobacter asburiae]
MATIPTLTYLPSDENVILQLISRPLPADADLFVVADNCAALVSVLVEIEDANMFTAFCERLLHALRKLRELCDVDLPPDLIAQLIMGEKLNSCVPDCWQDTLTQVDYVLALTKAVRGGTLPAHVAKELTGLLHDMVWLLAEFVKEPRITTH